MTAYQDPIDSLSTACGHTETETETETNTERGDRNREREKNRNMRQRRKRQTESETTDRRVPSDLQIVVPHQGFIAMDVVKTENRIHLRQAWLGFEESKITIVGRQNLEALIEALQEAKEQLL